MRDVPERRKNADGTDHGQTDGATNRGRSGPIAVPTGNEIAVSRQMVAAANGQIGMAAKSGALTLPRCRMCSGVRGTLERHFPRVSYLVNTASTSWPALASMVQS